MYSKCCSLPSVAKLNEKNETATTRTVQVGVPMEFMNHKKNFIWYARPITDDLVEYRRRGPRYNRSFYIGGTKSNYSQDEPKISFIETCQAQVASNGDIQIHNNWMGVFQWDIFDPSCAQYKSDKDFSLENSCFVLLLKQFHLLRAVTNLYLKEKIESVTIINDTLLPVQTYIHLFNNLKTTLRANICTTDPAQSSWKLTIGSCHGSADGNMQLWHVA